MMFFVATAAASTLFSLVEKTLAFAPSHVAPPRSSPFGVVREVTTDDVALFATRRDVLQNSIAGAAAAAAVAIIAPQTASADSLAVDEFLRTGNDSGGVMGVSGQAGKSRPQTGVVFRDGSEMLQDRSGNVVAEILIGTKANPTAVLASFSSPLKLEKGGLFDVECRDAKTGDGVFLAVTENTGGKRLADLPSSFFLERVFGPTGRFSFYGSPTDVKVKNSRVEGDRRYLEVSFSNLSQSTNAEIPRKALIVATIPKGTENAVVLVASSNALRWKKGAEETATKSVESFRATLAPKTSMTLRAKDRTGGRALDLD